MTALKEFERLEASALWRATPEAQRREVIVSFGDSTLVVTDMQDRPLTHWSLAAVKRLNPGERPARYCPDGDPGETLELGPDEAVMIDAIEKLRRVIDRRRPHPGRLRYAGLILSVLTVGALTVFWLPGAVQGHASSVVPAVQQINIGQALMKRMERVTGPVCANPDARGILNALARRTGVREIQIMRSGKQDSLTLPGGLVLLNRALIEDYEDPAVAAGYIIAEKARTRDQNALELLLRDAGVMPSVRLLTTGKLDDTSLDHHAETLMTQERALADNEDLLSEFEMAELPSTPYAYARDVTGETTLPLIEGDPMRGQAPAEVLPDRDWVLLQDICG